MDLAGLIADFATGSYTVTRRAAATTDGHGRNVAGATSSISIVAAVAPASGRDLLRLPEGRRANETRMVLTATALLVGGQGAANEADLISIDGASWEVQHVEVWRQPGVDAAGYKALVQAVTA